VLLLIAVAVAVFIFITTMFVICDVCH